MVKLFLGNLPYKVTEKDIRTFFSDAGVKVETVTIMRDKFNDEARGFGFVEIADAAVAARAIESCNGRALLGRAVLINEARPLEERPPRESRGGGRRERPRF